MEHGQSNSDYLIRSKNNEDYISKLPHDILERILTIYPLEPGSKAVAFFTGLLDRSYEQALLKTFNCVNILCFLFANFDENNPIKTRRRLEYHLNHWLILTSTIALNKKQLDLDISLVNQETLPFESKYLIHTINCALIGQCPSYVKTLKLTSDQNLSYDFASSLTSKIIPFVKCLIIDKCNGLRSLRVERLGELISLTVLDCVALETVYVNALNLKSLRHRGNLCWFSFKNVTHLEDVELASKGPGFQNLSPELFIPLLRAIRDVKVLTLHGWMYKEVFGPLLFTKHNELHFKFSKLTDLWWIVNNMEDDNTTSLFCFLKFCTSLKRLFITIDPKSYSSPNPFVYDNQSSIKAQKWRLPMLKVVKLEGITDEVDIMFIKAYLRKVFDVEPHVVDVRQGMHVRCLIRTTEHKTKHGHKRRSTIRTMKRETLGIPVKSNRLKFYYKFVEQTEDTIGLSSKHPHML